MNRDELELVARALATAAHQIEERLSEDLPDTDHPDDVLASIDDEDEFKALTDEWIADAEKEIERRRQLVSDEIERRSHHR